MSGTSSEPGLARIGGPLAVAGIGVGHRRGRSLRAVGHTAKLVQARSDRPYAKSNEEEKTE